jgi:taurine dioxygenase
MRIAMNNWVKFYDKNINSMSDLELQDAFRNVATHTVVVFKNQNLTTDDQLRICSVAGEVENTLANPLMIKKNRDVSNIPGIARVTGEKNERGREGLFGHKETLDWHCNKPSEPNRKSVVWLYGVKGTKGSKTSWINMVNAYNDLSDKIKEEINDIIIYCGYKAGTVSPTLRYQEHVNRDLPYNLVMSNHAGVKGLFFPFLQIMEFANRSNDEFSSIMKNLIDHVLNEKYAYHHDWDDGDIVISDQWLSIHKRWHFDGMDKRLLHRIACDYKNVYN